ncbi:hypothetical protein [Pantoea sp. S18]|uniref:RipA family octameric membrane protein n=1 Tax=Pantoea sp. S18 TaxID=3019892 RepID=UPI002B21BA33|nr:hypothetical protein [Pantoea sp. S18]MEA5104469.1 hypothetical protein [Pantoea sp. S18]
MHHVFAEQRCYGTWAIWYIVLTFIQQSNIAMNNMKMVTVRKQEAEYLSLLLDKKVNEGDELTELDDKNNVIDTIDYMKIKEAYSKSHDIRKFEIDLYWKRATYFWLFMVALFTLIGLAIKSDDHFILAITPLVCIFGILISQSFNFANKGSKYWQEHWEKNLDMLEFYVSGDLYKIKTETKDNKPSVSFINEYISASLVNLWKLTTFLFVVRSVIMIDSIFYKIIILFSYFALALFVERNTKNKLENKVISPSGNVKFSKR